MSFTNYYENASLNHIVRNTPVSMFTPWIGLGLSAPDEDGSPTNEIVAGWYGRKQPATGWNTATAAGVTNNGIIQWDMVTGSSETVAYILMFDTETSGNLIWYEALASPRLFGINSEPYIDDTELQVTLSGMFSNYLRAAWLDHVVGNSAYTAPGVPWLSLYTNDPTAADTGTEVSVGGYARLQTEFDAPSLGVTQNTNLEDFGIASADLGDVTHMVLRDANAAGNALFFGPLGGTFDINDGDSYKVPVGNITLTVD